MTVLAALFGILIAAIGVLGVVSPPRLISLVSRLQSQRGLYLAAAIRIVFGAALVFAAAGSKAPGLLHVFGILALVAGALTPFFGVKRFEALLAWWSHQPSVFLRAWCVVVLALGVAVIWAIGP